MDITILYQFFSIIICLRASVWKTNKKSFEVLISRICIKSSVDLLPCTMLHICLRKWNVINMNQSPSWDFLISYTNRPPPFPTRFPLLEINIEDPRADPDMMSLYKSLLLDPVFTSISMYLLPCKSIFSGCFSMIIVWLILSNNIFLGYKVIYIL